MDRSAIEAIQEVIASSMDLPETDVPMVVAPVGCKPLSLETFMDRPRRQSVNLTTERLEDFVSYVGAECHGGGTVVFIHPNGAKAVGIIDFGNYKAPMWKQHRIRLGMPYTPEYKAALGITHAKINQRALTDWLEDWAEIITPFVIDGEKHAPITVAKAIAAIRRVEIKQTSASEHEEGDFRRKQSGFAEIEARSKAGFLPAYFQVSCRVFSCTMERTVNLRLSMLTGDKEPEFSLRVKGADQIEKETASEVEEKIRGQLGGLVRVFVGDME